MPSPTDRATAALQVQIADLETEIANAIRYSAASPEKRAELAEQLRRIKVRAASNL